MNWGTKSFNLYRFICIIICFCLFTLLTSIAFAEAMPMAETSATPVSMPLASNGSSVENRVSFFDRLGLIYSTIVSCINRLLHALPVFANKAFDLISTLTADQITLISVLVTLLLFVFGKLSETKYKQLDARRNEYRKFILLLRDTFTKNLNPDEMKSKIDFFETGSSLLIYGSKKVYKKYILFREFTSNPLIQKSKYNIDGLLVYVIGDILKSIRHEVGLTSIGDLTTNEALSFIVNNFAMNPLQKIKTYKAKYCIFMIRVELFMYDRINFVYVKKGYYYLIKPVIGMVWLTLRFLVLYPIIKLLSLFFPQLKTNIENSVDKPQSK
ncbi:MAG: hypothetical protein IKU38_08140 [Clostridia bacterium]|nr:hypothetical protein [Clostridia bacterium]